MAMPPREAAISIIRDLRAAGHIAYLAGGCVRDELLGRAPKDYDVATDAPPGRVGELFRGSREVGKAFGVMLVRRAGITIEVTTFRREHGYADRRRPDNVSFCDALSDAHRRDFTINALFIDPLAMGDAPETTHEGITAIRVAGVSGVVLDAVGGLTDLRAKVIRAVGDPDARLREDDLRALRAVRFAARLGFAIDPATAAAIRRHSGDLAGISAERIGDELRMMLAYPARAEAVRLLEHLGLDAPVLGEPARGDPPVPHPTLTGLPPSASFPLALAGWCLGRHTAMLEASDVDAGIDAAAARYRRTLCLSNDERSEFVSHLALVALLEQNWPGLGVAARKRTASVRAFLGAMSLLKARSPALADRISEEVSALARTPGGLNPDPWLTGDDLIALGFTPSPWFGKWLDLVYDAQLDGSAPNREAAIVLLKSMAGIASGGSGT